MASIAKVEKKLKDIERQNLNPKFNVEFKIFKRKMFLQALLEGLYQSGQKVHQIGLSWLCESADISKRARQIISLLKFVDSTMNFGLYFVFQCL